MSTSSSDLSRQYIASLSILAVAVFIGVPIWWKTTEVYRCPLPYKEIEALRKKHVPPELAIKISVALLSDSNGTDDDHKVGSLVAQLSKELVIGSISARNTRISIRYIVQSHTLGARIKSDLLSYIQSDSPEDFSTHVSKALPSLLGHYFVLLVPHRILSKEKKPSPDHHWGEQSIFVSKHRHAIVQMDDKDDFTSCLSNILKVVRQVYGDRKQLERILKNSAGINQDRVVDRESMRQLRASQGYQLSFTLLNPDPSKVQATWNIQESTEEFLLPFLEHPGISSLGKFTVSSQEFYYTDVKFHPKKDGNGSYILSSQLPPMISSVESKLGSHVSQLPSLNFLIYVPTPSESPLFIRPNSSPRDRHSQTDNFLVPQWGGVVIYNPEKLSLGGPDEFRGNDGEIVPSVTVKMEKLMPVFITQLKMLLGIPNTPLNQDGEGRFHFSSGRYGITDWRVDQLLIGKLIESISMATTSLVSLVQLLDKVKNMVISDHIQHKVEHSLTSIQECFIRATSGNLNDAYFLAKQAMESAEIAFFDPSILELLYFPDDQKFAIYIPLFLPISVPILFSSVAAIKWFRARYRGSSDETPPTKPPKVEDKVSSKEEEKVCSTESPSEKECTGETTERNDSSQNGNSGEKDAVE